MTCVRGVYKFLTCGMLAIATLQSQLRDEFKPTLTVACCIVVIHVIFSEKAPCPFIMLIPVHSIHGYQDSPASHLRLVKAGTSRSSETQGVVTVHNTMGKGSLKGEYKAYGAKLRLFCQCTHRLLLLC